ncbi:MAG: hypothetical protein AB7K37_11315 [Cyclobacteriaceae bacterium]
MNGIFSRTYVAEQRPGSSAKGMGVIDTGDIPLFHLTAGLAN